MDMEEDFESSEAEVLGRNSKPVKINNSPMTYLDFKKMSIEFPVL